MYALYRKKPHGSECRFIFQRQISLFGCNVGWLPRLLRRCLRSDATEPLPWHLRIEAAMQDEGYPEHTLIIDLRPNSSKPNLSLYEISEVWGHCSHGWTPILFYLKGLFVDEDPALFDRTDFIRGPADIDDPLFSMMYLHGTVRAGSLYDRWTPPGPSPTNSVLLWPETFTYFADGVRSILEHKAHPRP